MKFRIKDLFKSRKTKIRERAQQTTPKPKEETKPRRPKTRRSAFSHGYHSRSTKNSAMLNLKYKPKRRKKNRIARRQRVHNSNHHTR